MAVPLVNRLWQWVFEKRARLTATIFLNEFMTTTKLVGVLDAAARLKVQESTEEYGRLKELEKTRTYEKIVLKNASRKRLNNVSISQPMGGFYQLGDGETQSYEGGEKINLGDLQPRHDVTVHFWQRSANFVNYISRLKSDIKISADELDRVSFKFPQIEYMQHSYVLIPNWVVYICGTLVFIAWMLFASTLKQPIKLW